MPRYKCTAQEVIYHAWEVEAETMEEARELAGEGCLENDCELDNGHFGDIKVVKIKGA